MAKKKSRRPRRVAHRGKPRRRRRRRSRRAGEVRVFLRRRKADGDRTMRDAARRQGRQPGRDDQRRTAGAARIHDHHRGLHVCGTTNGRKLHARDRDRDGRQRAAAREANGHEVRHRQANPLLVSVRSGAKFSMPGMMDTILNLGLNDEAVEGLKARRTTAASPTTATAASSRCTAASCSRSGRTSSSTTFEAVQARARRQERHRARRAAA